MILHESLVTTTPINTKKNFIYDSFEAHNFEQRQAKIMARRRQGYTPLQERYQFNSSKSMLGDN